MGRVSRLLLAVLVLAALEPVLADRLELENGDVVSGTIVSMNEEDVVISTGYGTLRIPRDRVVLGSFGEASADDEASRGADGSLTDLVFRFPLDGTLADAAGTNTLTNNGMAYVADAEGRPRGALRSDGEGTYLSVPPTARLDELGAFTLTFRVRLESIEGTAYLVSKWDRAEGETARGKFTIQSSSGGLTFFLVEPDGRYHWLAARGVLRANTWHSVAVSFAAGRAAVYVDAALVRERTFAFTDLAVDESPLLFMTAVANAEDAYGYYNATGAIDEIRLYPRALGAEEIALVGTPDDPVLADE